MEPAVESVALKLVVYGPLGIICVILLGAVVVLYRGKEQASKEFHNRIQSLQDSHQAEVRELSSRHKEEITTMVQRHITKAETWVEKGNELAGNLHAVLDSIARRGKV